MSFFRSFEYLLIASSEHTDILLYLLFTYLWQKVLAQDNLQRLHLDNAGQLHECPEHWHVRCVHAQHLQLDTGSVDTIQGAIELRQLLDLSGAYFGVDDEDPSFRQPRCNQDGAHDTRIEYHDDIRVVNRLMALEHFLGDLGVRDRRSTTTLRPVLGERLYVLALPERCLSEQLGPRLGSLARSAMHSDFVDFLHVSSSFKSSIADSWFHGIRSCRIPCKAYRTTPGTNHAKQN